MGATEDADHLLFRAVSDVKDDKGHVLVTAYAVLRPDGQWALLLINKDHEHPHPVHIVFSDAEEKTKDTFAGPVTMFTFGKTQYTWHPNRKQGYADPDGPAAVSTLQAGSDTVYTLPAASVTVLRGKTGGASQPSEK